MQVYKKCLTISLEHTIWKCIRFSDFAEFLHWYQAKWCSRVVTKPIFHYCFSIRHVYLSRRRKIKNLSTNKLLHEKRVIRYNHTSIF